MVKKINEVLKKIGLSKNEIDMYVFLSKKGAQKGTAIAKKFKMHRGHVYRILKRLEKKSVIETTLEYPKRFIAVPISIVVDSFIITKREEVRKIENSKEDLLSDWQKIKQIQPNSALDKFSVIEGERKIFHKISKMFTETKKDLRVIGSIKELINIEKYGVIEEINFSSKNKKSKTKLLTQMNEDNLKTFKLLFKKLSKHSNFKIKDLEKNSIIFPKLIIKDRTEILIFISHDNQHSKKINNETVLCTNCESIIKSFSNIFDELWGKSIDVKTRIEELEYGRIPSRMEIIIDPQKNKMKFQDALEHAKTEIFIVTSSKRLVEISKNIDFIKKLFDKNIQVKIMAPITTDNLDATQRLLKYCEVRHIPVGYGELTIFDNQILFQFNNLDYSNSKILNFDNVLYSTDTKHINQTKKVLFDIWEKTHAPSPETLESLLNLRIDVPKHSQGPHSALITKKSSIMQNMEYLKIGKLNEEKILKKIYDEKHKQFVERRKNSNNVRLFGTRAFAIIHPPKIFDLPTMIIGAFNHTKESTFGAENILMINILKKTKRGQSYIPIAYIQDNQKSYDYRKKVLAGYPAADNINVVNKNEFHVQVTGTTVFVAWTQPIVLGLTKKILPPSCLLFEGYGNVKPGAWKNTLPSGRKLEFWYNYFDAFVSYFHPISKYSGSGTEGFVETNTVQISKPSE